MSDNKNKTDRIHDQMPRFYKTKTNPNWKALITALGDSDDELAELVEEVRKQFFIKTAERPYLDRLGANYKVSRPKFVGMDDPTFRTYVPVLAYQPKQVKLVLDLLLDIFFFKESTTSFTQSENSQPFNLVDGWELEYTVDGDKLEDITFNTTDFVDITAATAEEVVGVINRSVQNSFAIVFDDRIKKKQFIRIFTNTIGSKGSLQITGGRADTDLRFAGFNNNAGSGTNTEWTVTKVGDTVTFQHTAGTSPSLGQVTMGDVAIIELPGNEGSFVIEEVDAGNSTFTFKNLFGTVGVFDHSVLPGTLVRFISPDKKVVFTNNNRALVWEVSPGEIIVEMPASPPVVKRSLAGSAHINGLVNVVSTRVSDTSLELDDANEWPLLGGQFVLQEESALQTHILTDSEDEVVESIVNSRFNKRNIFTYTGKTGNFLNGITPNIPSASSLHEANIASATRDATGTVTVTTTAAHGFAVGESVRIQNTVSPLSTTGIRVDISILDSDLAVAVKAAARITGETDFSAIAIGNQVQITNVNLGLTTDAADIDSTLTPVIAQQGTVGLPEITQVIQNAGASWDVAGNGLRWEISNANDLTRYHVWYKTIDGANTQVNAGLDDSVNGTFIITSIPSTTTFTYIQAGELGTVTGGVCRVEKFGLSSEGSLAYLTSAQTGTGILGPNIWDTNAAFVLSSLTTNATESINAGNNVRTIGITPINNIPDEEGFVIFGFGTENEEGPIRYLFKPTSSSIQLDPAYVFENNHAIGEAITVIRRRGAHVISSTGKEYAPYITDPAIARTTLQELLRQTKSVGIFIEFLIRFPEQLYATLDVYGSGDSNLQPITSS